MCHKPKDGDENAALVVDEKLSNYTRVLVNGTLQLEKNLLQMVRALLFLSNLKVDIEVFQEAEDNRAPANA